MQQSDLELYRAVVEQGPDALIFADREGTIKLWNARAEALFGYAAGEAIGRSLDLIIPENLRAAHWRGYRQAITLGHVKSGGHALATLPRVRSASATRSATGAACRLERAHSHRRTGAGTSRAHDRPALG